jgi:hypothetical protein
LFFSAIATAFSQTQGPKFLPLEPGNTWTYREVRGGQEFRVRVSTPMQSNGRIYTALAGYAGERPVFVRYDETGNLVRLNEETLLEDPFTNFLPADSHWWYAPLRPCDQEGQTQEQRVIQNGPQGYFEDVLEIRYRTFSCQTGGVLRERFAAGVGMLNRTVATVDGVRHYELVHARVGKFEFSGATAGKFSVAVEKTADGRALDVTLRLAFDPVDGMRLDFPTAQQYDLALSDREGNPLWRWSDGKVFAEAATTRQVFGGWIIQERVPLPEDASPEAKYEIQAWITTVGVPRYAASATIR